MYYHYSDIKIYYVTLGEAGRLVRRVGAGGDRRLSLKWVKNSFIVFLNILKNIVI